jgi:hypothetical protein
VRSILAALTIWTALASQTASTPASAPPAHTVKGTVVDAMAGVLPGVSVVATAADGRTLATAVTNGAGVFTFDGLPEGRLALRFHLDGFADATAAVTIPAPDNTTLVQKLELSSFSETVNVRADPPPPPPPPPRVLAPVPDHDPGSVCGPAKAEGAVPGFGAIKSRRTSATQGLFAPGDELIIETGIVNLLAPGQNFAVRRRFATPLVAGRNQIVMGEHTSGLLQIVEIDGPTATAVVVYACDEMMTGDYLAPFEPERPATPDPAGTPVFDKAARLLFADAGQMLGSKRRLLVIGHGSRDGIKTGQRLTIFRRSLGQRSPLIIGTAVVVAVRRESATIRVEHSVDVIFLGDNGDWVAPQRSPVSGRN